MHELALMDDLVSAVIDEVGGDRVTRVCLAVGKTSGVSVHALRFCFDVCTQGTSLENAALEITETDGVDLQLQQVEVT